MIHREHYPYDRTNKSDRGPLSRDFTYARPHLAVLDRRLLVGRSRPVSCASGCSVGGAWGQWCGPDLQIFAAYIFTYDHGTQNGKGV